MTAELYKAFRAERLKGNVDFINDDITVLLVAGYVPDLDADRVEDDIPEEMAVLEVSLVGQTVDEGLSIFTADSVNIPSLTHPDPVTGLVVMKNTDNSGTTGLIAYIDLDPFTPDGTPITIIWDAVLGIIQD